MAYYETNLYYELGSYAGPNNPMGLTAPGNTESHLGNTISRHSLPEVHLKLPNFLIYSLDLRLHVWLVMKIFERF